MLQKSECISHQCSYFGIPYIIVIGQCYVTRLQIKDSINLHTEIAGNTIAISSIKVDEIHHHKAVQNISQGIPTSADKAKDPALQPTGITEGKLGAYSMQTSGTKAWAVTEQAANSVLKRKVN